MPGTRCRVALVISITSLLAFSLTPSPYPFAGRVPRALARVARTVVCEIAHTRPHAHAFGLVGAMVDVLGFTAKPPNPWGGHDDHRRHHRPDGQIGSASCRAGV